MDGINAEQRAATKDDGDVISDEDVSLKRKCAVVCETSTSITPINTSNPFHFEIKTEYPAQDYLCTRFPTSPSALTTRRLIGRMTPYVPTTQSIITHFLIQAPAHLLLNTLSLSAHPQLNKRLPDQSSPRLTTDFTSASLLTSP